MIEKNNINIKTEAEKAAERAVEIARLAEIRKRRVFYIKVLHTDGKVGLSENDIKRNTELLSLANVTLDALEKNESQIYVQGRGQVSPETMLAEIDKQIGNPNTKSSTTKKEYSPEEKVRISELFLKTKKHFEFSINDGLGLNIFEADNTMLIYDTINNFFEEIYGDPKRGFKFADNWKDCLIIVKKINPETTNLNSVRTQIEIIKQRLWIQRLPQKQLS